MPSKEEGIRIRLDLSNFVSGSSKFRWMFLPFDEVKSISDVIDKLKSEYPLDESDQLTCYLEEPFSLPAWETIRTLQNGDLVVIKRRQKKRKRTNTEDKNAEELSPIKNSTSSRTEKRSTLSTTDTSEERVQRKQRVGNSKVNSNENRALSHNKSTGRKGQTNLSTSSVLNTSKKGANPSKSTFSVSSTSDDDVEEINATRDAKQAGMSSSSETSSSSSSESSSEESSNGQRKSISRSKKVSSSSEASEDQAKISPPVKTQAGKLMGNQNSCSVKGAKNRAAAPDKIGSTNGVTARTKPKRKRNRKRKPRNRNARLQKFNEELYNAFKSIIPASTPNESVDASYQEPATSTSQIKPSINSSKVEVNAEKSGLKDIEGNQFSSQNGSHATEYRDPNIFGNQIAPSSANVTCEEALLQANHSMSLYEKARLVSKMKKSQVSTSFTSSTGTGAGSNNEPDFENMPKLSKLPDLNDKIAFKVFELGADYTPGVSGFKSGIVIKVDAPKQEVSIKMDTKSIVRRSGKFEIEDEEDNLIQELQFGNLIDPRIIKKAM